MKKNMIPNRDSHTMQPARHLSKNMKMKLISKATPAAASSHYQLFLISLMKSAKAPCCNALLTEVEIAEATLVNMLELGTHSLSSTRVVS